MEQTMTIKNTIDSYRKRRNQMTPIIVGAAAVLLVVIGIIVLVVSLSGGDGIKLFSTKTPTPTITYTPTNTFTPTETATITPTPTVTTTATPSGPYDYIIQEGDSLYQIAADHDLGDYGIVLIYLLNPYDPNDAERPGVDPNTGNIVVGQTILLPPPGMEFPTPTQLPTGIAPGYRATYFVLPGDSLGSIANKMNSTIDAIVNANKTLLVDGADTAIYPGWTLIVPVDLVTPVPTATLTATATP